MSVQKLKISAYQEIIKPADSYEKAGFDCHFGGPSILEKDR